MFPRGEGGKRSRRKDRRERFEKEAQEEQQGMQEEARDSEVRGRRSGQPPSPAGCS